MTSGADSREQARPEHRNPLQVWVSLGENQGLTEQWLASLAALFAAMPAKESKSQPGLEGSGSRLFGWAQGLGDVQPSVTLHAHMSLDQPLPIVGFRAVEP